MEFITDEHYLEEDYRVEDLLDFSEIAHEFKNALDGISTNALVGLIGAFGSGKSTMLYQLYRNLSDKDKEKWVIFDAWKYPERKDLWEGFVLDFAKSIALESFKKTKAKIDGRHNDDKATLIDTIGDIPLPGFSAIKNLKHFVDTSPAKRVFEIQEILIDLIKELNKELFIVVEDIDRSGDQGVYFLETLRNFIKENKFSQKIIVIAPIGTEVLTGQAEKSYGKCLDYRFEFQPSYIDFTNFIKTIIIADILKENNVVNQLNSLFQSALRWSLKPINLRQLKGIIREAVIDARRVPSSETLDVRVFLTLAFLGYMKKDVMPVWSLVDGMKTITHDQFGYDVLIWIANSGNINSTQQLDGYVRVKIRILLTPRRPEDIIPRFNDFTAQEEKYYVLTDGYLKYLHM